MASRVRGNVHARFWGGEKAEITSKPYLFLFRVLAKYLSIALTQIDFSGLAKENHFGDITVQIEKDNLQDENFDEEEYALAAPF